MEKRNAEATRECLAAAAMQLFAAMCDERVALDSPDAAHAAQDRSEISAFVEFEGNCRGGFVGVHLTTEMALRLAGMMTGESCTAMDDIVRDSVGEIANVIAGALKTEFDRRGEPLFGLSIPSVVDGTCPPALRSPRRTDCEIRVTTGDRGFRIRLTVGSSSLLRVQ